MSEQEMVTELEIIKSEQELLINRMDKVIESWREKLNKKIIQKML